MKSGSFHGGVEGRAQRGAAVVRNAGRRKEGTAEKLAGEMQAQDGALLVALGQVEDERNLGGTSAAFCSEKTTSRLILRSRSQSGRCS